MDITKIPDIMRHHNWTNGARLMESWFARPVAIKPAYSNSPEYVRMQWALGYSAAKSKYDEIFDQKIWSNTAARPVVRDWLQGKNLLRPGQCTVFGDLTKNAKDLDDDAVNYRAAGGYVYNYYSYSGLNDLTAALGRFVLKVAIKGGVESAPNMPGKFKCTVSEVGVFIRDTYDFQGDQSLGYWDDGDNSVSATNPFSGDKVTNESFRDWRSANGRGGDFLVFSDVKRTVLKTPDTFII